MTNCDEIHGLNQHQLGAQLAEKTDSNDSYWWSNWEAFLVSGLRAVLKRSFIVSGNTYFLALTQI